jgi:hypothetical protein
MTSVTCWRALLNEVARVFPAVEIAALHPREGDMGALMKNVAEAHDLTFAEAAEVVTFRLPHYLEAERLSA